MTASNGKPFNAEKKNNNDNVSDISDADEFIDAVMFKFENGDSVLSRWRDGLSYMATVEKVDISERKLLLRYEDGTKSWADVKDVRASSPWEVNGCSQCLMQKAAFRHIPAAERAAIEETKSKELLHKCSDCGWSYHESCHTPNINAEMLALQGGPTQFVCRTCVFMVTVKFISEEKTRLTSTSKAQQSKRDSIVQLNLGMFSNFEKIKRHLPYSLDNLIWKGDHSSNEQNTYCYCGGPGKWSNQMFQCGSCRQWFHEACVRASAIVASQLANRTQDAASSRTTKQANTTVPKLVSFDTYYAYTCATCSTDGVDVIERVPISWVDLLSICLLNVSDSRPKLSLKNSIIPWMKENVKQFVLESESEAIPTSDNNWFDHIVNILKSSPSRFLLGTGSSTAGGANASKTPSPTTTSSSDMWCQLRQRSYAPRKLASIVTSDVTKESEGNANGTTQSQKLAQRQMRVRAKKTEVSGDAGSVNEETSVAISSSISTVAPSAANTTGKKRSLKQSLTDAATEKVLKKMAGVAQLLTTGYHALPLKSKSSDQQGTSDMPELNPGPFCRLMPVLHKPTTSGQRQPASKLSVAIPSHPYFTFSNGDIALFRPLDIDIASISPSQKSSTLTPRSTSSTSPGSNLVGAKKRKAYRPLHTVSGSSDQNRWRQSHTSGASGGSDGISTASSVSPMAVN